MSSSQLRVFLTTLFLTTFFSLSSLLLVPGYDHPEARAQSLEGKAETKTAQSAHSSKSAHCRKRVSNKFNANCLERLASQPLDITLPVEAVGCSSNEKHQIPGPTVAVLYFDYSGNDPEMVFLRKGLAQMLVTDLSKDNELQIVERTDLEAIIRELRLNRSKKIDPRSRNKIGKLLGARYLVTGGYFQFGDILRVDAKIIDVERGTTTSVGAQENPSKFMRLETQLATQLCQELRRVHKIRVAQKPKTRRKPRRRGAHEAHTGLDARQGIVPAASSFSASTVARYGKALDAIDNGNKKVAVARLQELTKSDPGFRLAEIDLRALLR